MADQPQGIGPEPSPQQVSVGHATDEAGRRYVVLQLNGVNGMWVAFLPPDFAKNIANQIISAAGAGLTIATADQLPPSPLIQ